jgi:glycosyltransferase involved in cell wall biosynthesis
MVTPSAAPGGMEEILYQLATHASRGGYEPHVIALRDGPLVGRLRNAGVNLTLVPTGRLRSPRSTHHTMDAIGALIRDLGPDILFSSQPFGHLYAWLPAWRAGLLALWCQANHPAPAHWSDRLASVLPATGVIALSRGSADVQRKLFGSPHVSVLHPGLDLSKFSNGKGGGLRAATGVPLDAPLAGIVGRLQPWKGQEAFLRAARQVLDLWPSAHFAVIGGAILGTEGDYPTRLRSLTRELRLEDRVCFTGHTENVPDWLAELDVMVNASHPEPFGMVVIEAMAAGTPVVAVRGGGPADIIEDGVSGVLVDEPTPENFARAIVALFENKESSRAMGEAGRARVVRMFTSERMACEFGAMLRELVDEQHLVGASRKR